MMKAVLLKCPPYARFHFGLTGLDENSSLYQTSEILHSDTLFSAILNTSNKIFGEPETTNLREAIKEGLVSFSSGYYVLESTNKERIFFLPKPSYFELINTDTQKRKEARKITFLSKGVWEKGILPDNWENECIVIQKKFVVLKEEAQKLLGFKDLQTLERTKSLNLSVYKIDTSPKIADHARRRTDNIFFQTDLHFAYNLINGQEILPHFYFLMKVADEYNDQMQLILDVLTDEGIGGGISTGCGTLAGKGVAEIIDFDFLSTAESEHYQISMSLISPTENDLQYAHFFKLLTRGGRPIAAGGQLKRVKMLQEGALMSKTDKLKGDIPRLHPNLEYYRNGKAFCIPIHQKYVANVPSN